MSVKIVHYCDHCGSTCESAFGAMMIDGAYDMPNVHGCSKEHLGLALAKAFGVPVDATTLSLVTESNRRLEMARQVTIELDDAKARIAELQKRLAEATAVPTVDGKTPGQVGHEAFLMHRFGYLAGPEWSHEDSVMRNEWEAAALAVLRAFGGEAMRQVDEQNERYRNESGAKHNGTAVQHAANEAISYAQSIIDDELARPGAPPSPKPFGGWDHPHEVGSCSHCDRQTANITDTKRPTKPATDHVHELGSYSHCDVPSNACTICGCPNERAFLTECIRGSGHNFGAAQ